MAATSVAARHLVHVVGLKRSGLHATAFWLLGHLRSHALFNNSPPKSAGDGTAMLRTIRAAGLPVRIERGAEVSLLRSGTEVGAHLPLAVDLLVVLWQHQDLAHLGGGWPPVVGVEAERTSTLLLLRNPYNWAASFRAKANSDVADALWPGLWRQYALEFLGRTTLLPRPIVPVNYDAWFADQAVRREVSASLGLAFTDRALAVVSSHAGGSSFDGTRFDGQAQGMEVAARWRVYADDRSFREAVGRASDVAALAGEIFTLPPDLEAFVAACRQSAAPAGAQAGG